MYPDILKYLTPLHFRFSYFYWNEITQSFLETYDYCSLISLHTYNNIKEVRHYSL